MGAIQKFEDLKVWQKARELNLQIYKLSNQGAFSNDFGLKNEKTIKLESKIFTLRSSLVHLHSLVLSNRYFEWDP